MNEDATVGTAALLLTFSPFSLVTIVKNCYSIKKYKAYGSFLLNSFDNVQPK